MQLFRRIRNATDNPAEPCSNGRRAIPAAANAWLRGIPAAELHELALAMSELRSARVRYDALVGIAQTWAQRDAPELAAWIAHLSPGELEQTVMTNVTAIWEQELLASPDL